MKHLFLIAVVAIFAACGTPTKKQETKADEKAVPAKAETKSADKKVDKKSGKKTDKKGGYEDEDISKPKTEAAAPGKTTCTSGSDSRVLEITSGEGKACLLNYTKQGNTQEVASAVADASHCNEVKEKIKAKLEAAGFKCE